MAVENVNNRVRLEGAPAHDMLYACSMRRGVLVVSPSNEVYIVAADTDGSHRFLSLRTGSGGLTSMTARIIEPGEKVILEAA